MTAVPFSQCNDITDVSVNGDTAHVDIWYPQSDDGRPKFLTVGLMDVRAADSIRISYDFDRDGWKVEQASIFEWEADDPVCDPDWQEVAFIAAWGREQESSE